MTARQWSLLVLLSFPWGGSYIAIEFALTAFPPPFIVFMRLLIAGVILTAVVRYRGIPLPRDWRRWIDYAVSSFLGTVLPFTLIVWGQTQVTGSVASILNAMTPIFTVIAAHFLTKDEPMTLTRFVGTIIAFFGIVALFSPALEEGFNLESYGQLAILVAAASYAFSGIWAKRFSAYPSTLNATGSLLTGVVMMLPVMVFWPSFIIGEVTTEAVIAILSIAVLSTALGFIIYFKILAEVGVNSIALVTFMIPISAVVLGYFMLGETLSNESVFAVALIFAGLAVIDGRLLKWIRQRR